MRSPRRGGVLLTGGAGFLGRHAARVLEKSSLDVHVYEGDVRRISQFKKKCETVCHLAAINRIGRGVTEERLFDVNVGGTAAVMRYCSRNGSRCIFASSAAVYKPNRRNLPMKETSPLGPTTLYGESKMLAESICAEYAKKEGVKVAILRFFNIYGPGQNGDFLIPYIISRIAENEPVMLNTPYAVRDFIHVWDAARALAAVCIRWDSGPLVFNVGTGTGARVQDVVKLAAGMADRKPRIALRKDCTRRKDFIVADTGLIRKYAGWAARIPLNSGLRDIAQDTGGILK